MDTTISTVKIGLASRLSGLVLCGWEKQATVYNSSLISREKGQLPDLAIHNCSAATCTAVNVLLGFNRIDDQSSGVAMSISRHVVHMQRRRSGVNGVSSLALDLLRVCGSKMKIHRNTSLRISAGRQFIGARCYSRRLMALVIANCWSDSLEILRSTNPSSSLE